MRSSGILMHISSLPGAGGIGSMGKEAFAFADFLKASGMTIWQVLPMGPTGYGESPYQSSSVYAGNPLLISCEKLREEGLLSYTDGEEFAPAELQYVDFPAVKENKEMLLRRAFAQSEKKLQKEIEAFKASHPWVEDFALFVAVKHAFNDVMWTQWPEEDIRMRRPQAVAAYRKKLDAEVRYHIFCQYLFSRQWSALKTYCNKLGIRLFGDMPIYVAEDSADTWTHPDVFQLDKNRIPKRVAGVPPDYFSADGQLWGNPLYRWTYLRFRGFDWWVDRMRHMATMYDLIRIDHFIGFANYYSVQHGAPNARVGKWVIGPGKALFKTLMKKVPEAHIIAEDLGEVSPRVKKLLAFVGYPGMKVNTFGYDGDETNPHFPANYVENCVVYTGTHDNDTTKGWYLATNDKVRAFAEKNLHFHGADEAADAFLRNVIDCVADTAVVPMQDVLGLDGSARMNCPGTVGNNWRWRMLPGAASREQAARLYAINKAAKRI